MTSVASAYTRTGDQLYVVSDNYRAQQCEVTLWSASTGELMAKASTTGMGARLSVSPDGRYVGLTCRQSLTIWDHDLHTVVQTLKLPGSAVFRPLEFSPDSRKLAVHVSVSDFDDALVVYEVAN
jgi:WD40 repeat protein